MTPERKLRTQPPDCLLKFVQSKTVYKIRCSDCECFGDDFFNQQQAAELSAKAGWLVLGEDARVVCNRCAAYYSSESIKK